MLNGREFFLESISKKPRNNIEKAALYYYSIVHSFGRRRSHYAMCKKARSPKNIYKSFEVYAKRLRPVIIESLDFRDFIKQYDSDATLFYLDPPYVGTENYYKNKKTFDLNDYKDLCEILKNINGKFLLSYNDCVLVRNLYKGFTLETLEAHYGINMQTQNVKIKEQFSILISISLKSLLTFAFLMSLLIPFNATIKAFILSSVCNLAFKF